MDLMEFMNTVDEHPDLEGLGIDTEKGILSVRYNPTGLKTAFPAGAVKEVEWDLLFDILKGDREPQVLHHMTRVVGYYSRIDNWNPSKIGELRDRQKGTYAIKESV
jgi:hypothetical protein